jgi:copper homeostasis protein
MELEICVDSVESAIAAEAGGADRVELCSALNEGGLTPSVGLMRAVRSKINIGMYVMIRPRGGDFVYSPAEIECMLTDISCAADEGADGVVLGLLTPDATVDVSQTALLVEQAAPMRVTFHRALDMVRDLDAALQSILETGAHRVLTSGAAPTAALGAERIASLVRAAGSKLGVMVCGHVRPENVGELASATGARQFHASLRKPAPSPMAFRNTNLQLGDPYQDDYARFTTSAEDVRRLREAVDAIGERRTATFPGRT